MKEKKKFEAALDSVLSLMGIYPAATVKEDGTEVKRTEWQDGWNSACMEHIKRLYPLLDSLETTDDFDFLLEADVGWLRTDENSQLIFVLNMNDTFFYACADWEDVSIYEANEVTRLFVCYGYMGLVYWVAEKRGYDPEIKKYKKGVEFVRQLENERKR